MALRRKATAPKTDIEVLLERIRAIEARLGIMTQSGATSVQRTDTALHGAAVPGEVVLHSPALTTQELNDELTNGYYRRQVDIKFYHDKRWRSQGDLIIPLSAATETPTAGETVAFVPISKDLDQTVLQRAEAAVLTSGSSYTDIDILLNGSSMLIDRLIIDSGDYHSGNSSSPVGIAANNNEVFWQDQITLDIVQAGAGSQGLTVILGFA